MKQHFIPVLTSEAGSCLTLANWQDLGVQTLAYYLDTWLMRPGYSLLSSLKNLRSYCGWPGNIALNASLAGANAEGIYNLRSHYDGSRIQINQQELFSLISQLQPDIVILPSGFARYLDENRRALPKTITSFVLANEYIESEYLGKAGIYLPFARTKSFSEFFAEFNNYSDKPTYLSGEFDLSEAKQLIEKGARFLESDKPAKDALAGLVYDKTNHFEILEKEIAFQTKPINDDCSCPTCTQKLTRAYLHHLLVQTPLLCQRFLIMHNVHNYPSDQ